MPTKGLFFISQAIESSWRGKGNHLEHYCQRIIHSIVSEHSSRYLTSYTKTILKQPFIFFMILQVRNLGRALLDSSSPILMVSAEGWRIHFQNVFWELTWPVALAWVFSQPDGFRIVELAYRAAHGSERKCSKRSRWKLARLPMTFPQKSHIIVSTAVGWLCKSWSPAQTQGKGN